MAGSSLRAGEHRGFHQYRTPIIGLVIEDA
jgi:hypothetical protein